MLKFLQNLHPDFEAKLTELPLGELQTLGVKVLAFDLDNTLTHTRDRRITSDTVHYMKYLTLLGFQLALASNSIADVSEIGTELNMTVIQATPLSRKPMKRYFRKLTASLDCEAKEVAMIGDRVLTDVFGANRSGMITIRVNHSTRSRSI